MRPACDGRRVWLTAAISKQCLMPAVSYQADPPHHIQGDHMQPHTKKYVILAGCKSNAATGFGFALETAPRIICQISGFLTGTAPAIQNVRRAASTSPRKIPFAPPYNAPLHMCTPAYKITATSARGAARQTFSNCSTSRDTALFHEKKQYSGGSQRACKRGEK